MIKVYIGDLIQGVPHTEILYPNLGNTERETPFGEKIFKAFTEPVVEIVENPEDADYFCIPHNYNYIKKREEYLADWRELGEKHIKQTLIFFPGDSDEGVHIPNAITFRNSQYAYKKKPNEVIMPGYACDLGSLYGMSYREKGEKPVIGFCGWANYGSLRECISTWASAITSALTGKLVHAKGLYFRREALSKLGRSEVVETNFILRSSYSGNAKTLTSDPLTLRREYVENMKNSDLVLAPKGDGNFSVRFFEALSLGRIPLLVDTDSPLPLEDEIDYDDFTLKVSYKKIEGVGDAASHFYKDLTAEEYKRKQEKCREVFETRLKIDVFFRYVLTKDFLQRMAYTMSK